VNPTHERYAWRARFLSRLNRFQEPARLQMVIPLITMCIGLVSRDALAGGKAVVRLRRTNDHGIKIAVTKPRSIAKTQDFMGTQQALDAEQYRPQARPGSRVAAAKTVPSGTTVTEGRGRRVFGGHGGSRARLRTVLLCIRACCVP